MDLKIKICTDDSCKVIIRDDTEVGGSGYLPENSSDTATNRFRLKDTVSIDLLQYNKSTSPELSAAIYTINTNTQPRVVLPVNQDGWFSVVHIILPSSDWFYAEKDKADSPLSIYQTVYFSDGNVVYKYIDNNISQVNLQEILDRNTEGTTISRVSQDYVSICLLKHCYIQLCQQIYNSHGFSSCWNKNYQNSEINYKRDLVHMTINVIKYLTQFNQLAEVQRIIENISGCTGLCKQSLTNGIVSNGCGCN